MLLSCLPLRKFLGSYSYRKLIHACFACPGNRAAGASWGVDRKDFKVLLRQGGDNEAQLREFLQNIRLNKEWQQVLLQSHKDNEPVDAEVGDSSQWCQVLVGLLLPAMPAAAHSTHRDSSLHSSAV
jgi:hypothetical protein